MVTVLSNDTGFSASIEQVVGGFSMTLRNPEGVYMASVGNAGNPMTETMAQQLASRCLDKLEGAPY